MPPPHDEPGPWPVARAEAWAGEHPWLVGCNFAPSTAINQLEMWQADTFDLATIDRELGWAEGLGFNSVRVFLHHLLWEQDAQGFLAADRPVPGHGRPAQDRRDVRAVRRCLGPVPSLRQAAHARTRACTTRAGCRARALVILKDPQRHDELKDYVTGVIGRFRADRRVHAWDLFNEPDNPNRSSYGRFEPANKPELALALLEEGHSPGHARSTRRSR